MDVDTVIKKALSIGFSYAVELDVKTLRFLPEVREMCSSDRCHSYNRNWTCPPACGTLEECEAKAAGFTSGIIVQTVGKLEDSFDYEGMMANQDRHKENFDQLIKQMRILKMDFFAMGAGACTICPECAYPDKPCRFPDRAVSSVEACGIWVSDLCQKNGIKYNYGQNNLANTSCVLFNKTDIK